MSISFRLGRTLATCAITAAVIVSVPHALAQTSSTETTIDPNVFNFFLESRIRKPAMQATPQERESVMKELQDVYLVTDLPRARELGEEAQIKAQIEFQRRALLFTAFAQDFVTRNPASEPDIRAAYDTEFAASPPKEFKARHILLKTQAQAADIIGRLQNGADFEALAKEHSTGPSGPSGGDLGWFNAQAMVKPFSDAVATLEDGAYTKTPVQTQFGWHVILRENSKEGTPPPFESVRESIKQKLEQDKFQAFLESLRNDNTD